MDAATLRLTQGPAARVYAMKTLRVTGWIKDTTITSAGNILSVRAGGMNNSSLFAGVTGTTLPSSWEGFSNSCLLSSVAITGIRNGAAWVDSFINSNIAAWTINSLVLNYPKLANTGTAFGATADAINRLSIRTATTAGRWAGLRDWSQSVRMPDLIVRLV